MKRSRRELSIDAVVHKGILKNNQIPLGPCFTLHLKQKLVLTMWNVTHYNVLLLNVT